MTLSTNEKQRLRSQYGPWAVITGASSGIGLELAERLAESGLNLVINSRRAADLAPIETRLIADYGIAVRTVAADMSEPAGVQTVLDATQSLPVGLLVASAGFGTSGPFIKSDLAEEQRMLRVNCDALLTITHAFSQRFAGQKRGGIILLSSLVGFQGVPFAANYAATKAYVQSLAEGIGVELKPYSVDVLAAAPGPVASGFGKRAGMNMDQALTPAQVGIPILKALGRQSTVLPGLLTKILSYSLATVPRWGKVRIMKLVMEGFTKHQAS